MKACIQVNHLTRRFGQFTAVDDLSFEIEPGQVVGYLGPNGSGKTTTIRMLLGIIHPTSGSAQIFGYDSVRQSEKIRSICGYMSQKFSLYQELTVRENLVFYAGVYGVSDSDRIDQTLEELSLKKIARQQVSSLSTGWKQRIALATAIVHRPQLLFLDEPTSGVDPVARREFWDLIYQLVNRGITVLVTTHYMDEAEYCNRVAIIREGKLLALDTPDYLKNNLSANVWIIQVTPLLQAFDLLSNFPGIIHVGLESTALRIVSSLEINSQSIISCLMNEKIIIKNVQPGKITLEDVYLVLSGKNNKNTR